MGHLRSITKSKTPRAVLLVLSRGVFFCDKSNLTHSNPKLRVSALPHFFAERCIYYLLTPNYLWGAVLLVLSRGVFFCDKSNLTHSNPKFIGVWW
jgi:hypothetical protein